MLLLTDIAPTAVVGFLWLWAGSWFQHRAHPAAGTTTRVTAGLWIPHSFIISVPGCRAPQCPESCPGLTFCSTQGGWPRGAGTAVSSCEIEGTHTEQDDKWVLPLNAQNCKSYLKWRRGKRQVFFQYMLAAPQFLLFSPLGPSLKQALPWCPGSCLPVGIRPPLKETFPRSTLRPFQLWILWRLLKWGHIAIFS